MALDLDAYKGKVVYVDFWASWCGPCKLSFPYMEELKASYAKDGLVIITVNLDRSRDRADAFIASMSSDLKVIYDPKGEIARAFKVKDMPSAVLVGRDGRVRFTHSGFFAEQTPTYGAQIQGLIDGK